MICMDELDHYFTNLFYLWEQKKKQTPTLPPLPAKLRQTWPNSSSGGSLVLQQL